MGQTYEISNVINYLSIWREGVMWTKTCRWKIQINRFRRRSLYSQNRLKLFLVCLDKTIAVQFVSFKLVFLLSLCTFIMKVEYVEKKKNKHHHERFSISCLFLLGHCCSKVSAWTKVCLSATVKFGSDWFCLMDVNAIT